MMKPDFRNSIIIIIILYQLVPGTAQAIISRYPEPSRSRCYPSTTHWVDVISQAALLFTSFVNVTVYQVSERVFCWTKCYHLQLNISRLNLHFIQNATFNNHIAELKRKPM